MNNNNTLRNNVYRVVYSNNTIENSLNELKDYFYNIFNEYIENKRFKIDIKVNKHILSVYIIPIDYANISIISLNSFIFEKLNNIGYYELKTNKKNDILCYKIEYSLNNLN